MSSSSNLQPPTLTVKKLYRHFLLLHDYLFKFTKTKAPNNAYFDLQITISQQMTKNTKRGGIFGQIFTFGGLLAYCLKSKKVGRKIIYGFLYMYWNHHFYTLGSYLGVFLTIPRVYKDINNYYVKHGGFENSPLHKITEIMDSEQAYEDTQHILKNVFGEQWKEKESMVTNNFFIKNKQKYQISQSSIEQKNLKLPVLDSFLTRYIYHSFSRWVMKVQIFLGLRET